MRIVLTDNAQPGQKTTVTLFKMINLQAHAHYMTGPHDFETFSNGVNYTTSGSYMADSMQKIIGEAYLIKQNPCME